MAAAVGQQGRESIRLDKWLWHARFFKSRAQAAKFLADGAIRVNATRVTKSATHVGPQDVLTFVLHDRVRVLRVLAPGTRRGPPAEAQGLYLELVPPAADVSSGALLGE